MKKMMRMSEAGITVLTQRFEGCQLRAYPDPGTDAAPWTAGYGHTGPDVKPGMVVTQAQADAWLRADLARAEAEVARLVLPDLSQHEFDALVDFEYNTGALANSTLLAQINRQNFDAAMREFGRWQFANGKRLAGLVRRRQQEAAWFATPDEPTKA
jgi:lysozyme